MAFFEIATPRDMLDKAQREYARLSSVFDIDNVFNFFVTAYHISDYVSKTNSVPKVVLDSFLSDREIQACHDLCDKGKHMRLTKKSRVDPDTVMYGGALGEAPLGVMCLSGGEKWVVFCGSNSFDVEDLAGNVIRKWERFFQDNGL